MNEFVYTLYRLAKLHVIQCFSWLLLSMYLLI
jgi:hypothetical protein